MQYFSVCQNPEYTNTVNFRIRVRNPLQRRQEIKKEDVENIRGCFRFDVISNPKNFYPDILDVPIFLVSNILVKVFKHYFEVDEFRSAMLMDVKNKQHHLYWLPIIKNVDCLHEETSWKKDGSLERTVLSAEKLNNHKIFRIPKVLEKTVIVHLEIAESILRRNCTGVCIKPVDIV